MSATTATPPLPAVELASTLKAFLSMNARAVLIEDGAVLFDMQRSQHAISAEHGRCILQIWSEERNIMRTITGLQVRRDSLRLEVRRLGSSTTQWLHLLADRNTRTASSRRHERTEYVKALRSVLSRAFSKWEVERLHNATDLEHSFGPGYARGLLVRGQRAWAVVGVNSQETAATIDGVLTVGILWLHYCRQRSGCRRVIEGLKVIAPAGASELTRSRMGWLDRALAKWELYEWQPGDDELRAIETDRNGNLAMRLPHAFEPSAALDRMAGALDRILGVLPENSRGRVDIHVRSGTELAVSWRGLEFARVRHGAKANSFAREDRITFGAAAHEMELTPETEPALRELVARLFASRRCDGDARDPLYRLQPERWLESQLRASLPVIEPTLRSGDIYQQTPAFAAGDRGMLDLLTANESGRLAILELKADEDLHMPLQGLDYWIRVRELHRERDRSSLTGGFERAGYFPGRTLSPQSPLLYFICPALRIHPAAEVVLRSLDPEVEWIILAINENWRCDPKVIWRKRSGRLVESPTGRRSQTLSNSQSEDAGESS